MANWSIEGTVKRAAHLALAGTEQTQWLVCLALERTLWLAGLALDWS